MIHSHELQLVVMDETKSLGFQPPIPARVRAKALSYLVWSSHQHIAIPPKGWRTGKIGGQETLGIWTFLSTFQQL